MKKILDLALGIATSIGGFLEAGSIITAAQAGAAFGYQLAWAILLGTLGLIVLVEASGRLAAVSQHTVTDAMRERFGFRFHMIPLVVVLLTTMLVLASEVGGVCLALQMATGIPYRWWAIPVSLGAWVFLWRGRFVLVEQGTAVLGLVTLAFIVAAVKLHPDWGAVAHAMIPARPSHDKARYWFLAVSILGASISPYLYVFYSAGALEDGWDASYLSLNRTIAAGGMTFGGTLSMAVLLCGALAFSPLGLQVDTFEQLGLLLVNPLGRAGFVLLLLSLGITCFGATLEIALSGAYFLAQSFGWEWGKNQAPAQDARFSLAYSLLTFIAGAIILAGIDPLKLTLITMSLTAATLPVTVVPMLVIMNDRRYLAGHVNGWMGNVAMVALCVLSLVLMLVAIPLQFMGG